MKIAIITERANITLGGAERSVFDLAGRLSVMGCKVKILAATGTSQSKRVEILCSQKDKRSSFAAFKGELREHFAKNHYDIIHSMLPIDFADIYQPRGGSYPEAIIRNAASYSNPIVSAYKAITSFANLKRRAFSVAEKKLCKNPNGPKVACLSEYVKKQFVKHYGLPEDSIFVVPNGVKVDSNVKVEQTDRLKSQILEKLGLKEADEPVLFLFAANNFRLKGLRSLIHALSIVVKRHTKRRACVVVVGRDKPGAWRHMARRLKVYNRIVFLEHSSNIKTVMAISDIVVLPTYYDPSSRIVLEALAAGKGVITTRYNGATDLIQADRHGKIYDSPDDIDSLAEAIRYYCNTENIEKTVAAIANDDIKGKVSIRAHCQKLMEIYNAILQEKGEK